MHNIVERLSINVLLLVVFFFIGTKHPFCICNVKTIHFVHQKCMWKLNNVIKCVSLTPAVINNTRKQAMSSVQ